MEREVRYCTTEDGVNIAYCVEGEGPPLLVTPAFVESFSLGHLLPPYLDFWRRLGEGIQLIFYDARGCGLSQRNVQDMSVPALVSDAEAVIRATKHSRIAVWASTTGGLRAISLAARNGETVSHLILYGAFSRTKDVYPESLDSMVQLARANWDLATQLFGQMGGGPEASAFAAWLRQSGEGEATARYIELNADVDLPPMLPEIAAKTLVLCRLGDPLYSVKMSQDIAASIPGARLMTLAGDVHLPYLGDSQAVIDAVWAFFDEDPEIRRRRPESTRVEEPGAVRTVLFTDLVGHTEMMSRLGDAKGRDVLREHERITRDVLKANGGTEVKTMGDGFMASFGSVTKAVECAVALQRAMEALTPDPSPAAAGEGQSFGPLKIRCGLNAGEPIEEDGDLFGATVILASRIAAKAEGGEILVADTVRGLCSGKGFLFADRGEFVAKGFEEPVRVYR
jgi:class 3 adenylate cyclase